MRPLLPPSKRGQRPTRAAVRFALAFRSRGENKDAYDLFYVLRNHGDGPRTVAKSFRPLLDDSAARDALGILEADFTTPESAGAMRVAAFLARQGDATFLADVAGCPREFVRLCGRGR